jgi:dUTP pyrophosphatase
MTLRYKKLHPNAKGPTVAHLGEDVAYDFYSTERVVILPRQKQNVPLGVAIEHVPPMGGLLQMRGGMGNKDLAIRGGVIDAGFRGEVIAMIHNSSNDTYVIEAGDKCVQMIPVPVIEEQPVEVDELSDSRRGEGKFGSTGK